MSRLVGGINVHLYPSTLTHESRMDRICAALATWHLFDHVVQVGVSGPGLAAREPDLRGFERVRLPGGQRRARGLLAKGASALGWSRRVLSAFSGQPVTCVNAHSLAVLPVAAALAARHGARLVYDTHELETETIGARGVRRSAMRALERLIIRRTDVVSVVSPSIARWYAGKYGIPQPIVVRNLPDARSSATSVDLRATLGIPPGELVFLYQGLLGRGRLIEEFLDAFRSLQGRHLVVMGFGELEPLVRAAASATRNVHFIPAVAPQDVHRYTAGADVGLCGVADACLSYRLSLPNKLFEYLSVGVPVLAPPLPDIADVLRESSAGWVVEPGDWRGALAAVTPDRLASAREAATRASVHYTWSRELPALWAVYAQVFALPSHPSLL